MPGTTRYSATFDRPYEEDDRVDPSPPPTARRSRSQSWQANSGLDSRPYTPLGGRILSQRSSSTDNGPSKIAEHIPTRTVNKTVVKPHTNPFQFVKVGTCPLYRKAEEQLKKVKEVKKPDVLEEEEEWQSNLDSWKSRRRKMSEDVFRRQEEIKQFELEEQVSQVSQKKTKTFSEMVESRAHRGRALSLCLISSPMELQNWEFENSHKNGSCSTFSGESEENSTANSEDEGVSLKGMLENSPNGAHNSHRTNGNSHIENDNADSHNGNYSKLSDISNNSLQMKSKEGSYIDSGLESISSHRAGDTPDSGSDFSHDSGSSIDCDSPRTGVNILEEFSSKSAQLSNGNEIPVKLCSTQKGQDFGFTFLGGKDRGQFLISSILEGSKADLSIHLGDQIISIDGAEIASKTQKEVASLIEKARERGEITLLLWRHTKCNSNDSPNGVLMNGQQSNGIKVSDNQMSYKSESYEKSIESENEMFVDDFEELQRQSELAAASNKSQANDSSPTKDVIPSVVLTEVTPVSKTRIMNGSIIEPNKTPRNSNSEVNKNTEKKCDVVPKARRKGVYALNVSPATQNSKEGFSVNSLFPLSPVTELPSPEDAKTLASSLSLEITSVSDDSTNSKESKSDVNVKASTDKKDNSKSLTNGGTEACKSMPEGGVSASKEEIKNPPIPSPPVITKNMKTTVSAEGAPEKKTKIVRKVKAKPKKDSTTENISSVASQPIKEPAINASSADKPKNIENNLTKKSDIKASNTKTNGECTKAISLDSIPMNKNVTIPAKSSQSATITAQKSSVSNLSRTPSVKDANKSESVESSSNVTPSKSESCIQASTKPSFVQRKTSNNKDTEKLTLNINIASKEPEKGKSPKTATPKTATPKDTDKKCESDKNSAEVSANETTPANAAESNLKSPRFKKTKIRTRKKNPNSPKANVQQVEESITTNSVDTLNVVFQSQPKNINSENLSNNLKNLENNSNKTSGDLVADILPVEKVAEEMEKLILQQLEEEERAKELASGLQTKSPFGSPEHLLTAPPKLTEPPKEKPPPPPPVSEETTKDSSIKRTNSTKRIKKEIHKRRSNFLGIENENSVAIEPSIPPPPALEEILKAEMELERQTRLQIENAAAERLTLEEKELMQREREIIETLESEERQKQLMNNVEEFYDIGQSNENDATVEEQIEFLKSEQKRLELERINEEQQLRLLEETQMRELKEREEFIKKQEADKSPVSDPSSHSVPKESNTLLSPLSVDTKSQVSNSGAFGDGKSLTTNSDSDISKTKSLDSAAPKVSQKPSVPPKPLKKKEAIRKERERLRQEQEALQREREEHRRKLQQEQEELAKQQKPHAPDAPVSRLGPLPPLVQPSFYSPLTATPFTRDVSCPSRSHHGASNIPVGNLNSVELTTPIVAKQGPMPPVRKPVQNEPWGQQKVTSVRKQNQDSLTESRYNQNHWLIQEAEMRRIAELKDRQRRTQLSRSQPNLAEDDVCSNGSRVSVLSPSHSQQHMNYPVQDKMWNYNQPNVMPIKKYPSPVAKEPLHVIYPRDTVPQQPPPKPSRVVPIERQEQMLSVSGRKRCSHCNEELGRGAAMIIESLQLYYHIHCFQCCVCQAQLGNGSCGTDVRVRNQKLHCHNCYSNDEAGLKFSQV